MNTYIPFLAEQICRKRQHLINKYPGPWVLTLDFEFLPEKIDPQLAPYHCFGFDTTDCNVIEQYLNTGLFVVLKSYQKALGDKLGELLFDIKAEEFFEAGICES